MQKLFIHLYLRIPTVFPWRTLLSAHRWTRQGGRVFWYGVFHENREFHNIYSLFLQSVFNSYMHNIYTIFAKFSDIHKLLQGIWSTGKEIYLSVGSFPDFLIWKWLLSTWLPDPLVLTANPFYLLSWESIIQRFLIWYPVGNIMTDENLRHLSVLPFVKRWQKPLFFHDGYALRFIVGAFYQIRNSVYHYQMPPYLDNGKQALFPAHSRKVIRLKPFQYRLTSATTQQVDDILIQLHFALFHVIEQDCLVLAVFVERNTQAHPHPFRKNG